MSNGIGALIEFKFNQFGTLTLARIVYALAFILVSIQAIIAIIYSISVGCAVTDDAVGRFLLILIASAVILGNGFLILAIARLVLEYLVINYKGHASQIELNEFANTPEQSRLSSVQPLQSNEPSMLESQWRCRCGQINVREDLACPKCKRAPNAIY